MNVTGSYTESKISNPRKSFDHPCHLKSGVPGHYEANKARKVALGENKEEKNETNEGERDKRYMSQIRSPDFFSWNVNLVTTDNHLFINWVKQQHLFCITLFTSLSMFSLVYANTD